MSFNLIRSHPKNAAQRLIGFRKLESFHPDGPMLRTPVRGAAARIFQGLDTDKVVMFKYIPFWKTRDKYVSGYQYAGRNGQPAVNAPSPEEMVTYFDNDQLFTKFSKSEVVRGLCHRYVRWYIFLITFPFLAVVGMLIYFIPSNRYEAPEFYMPLAEYYENYVWHDLGKYIDKKAFDQYLEARRAKKWGRDPFINVIDYIPEKYRSKSQRQERSGQKSAENKLSEDYE